MDCPNGDDYSPCHCSDLALHCRNVSVDVIAPLIAHKESKNNTNHQLDLFGLTTQPINNIFIPAHLFGNVLVMAAIRLQCGTISVRATQRMRIHTNAFRSSENITNVMSIVACDLSALDYLFLNGFHQLKTLAIDWAVNVHLANWTTLPPLSGLKILNITNSEGLNKWIHKYPELVSGLIEFKLISCNIGDVVLDRMLQWLQNSSSNALEVLYLKNNTLTKIPQQLPFFKKLSSINLDFNPLSTALHNASFIFSQRPFFLTISLRSCGIDIIQPDAFQGLNFTV